MIHENVKNITTFIKMSKNFNLVDKITEGGRPIDLEKANSFGVVQ